MEYDKTNLCIALEFVTVFGAVMYAGNVCIFTFLKKLKFVIIKFFTRVLVSKLDTFIIKPLQSRVYSWYNIIGIMWQELFVSIYCYCNNSKLRLTSSYCNNSNCNNSNLRPTLFSKLVKKLITAYCTKLSL